MKKTSRFLRAFLLSLALIVCVCMLFTACGDDDETPDSGSTPSTGSSSSGTTESSKDPAPCTHKGGEATCTAKAKCTECGEEYGELKAHDFAEATCVAPKTCKTCKATEGEALGHDEVDDVVAPTCTEAGITNITCSRCDYTSTKDPVDALGHDEIYDVIAPTCVAGGITNVTCSRCDYTATKDPTEATGEHKYDVKGETVEPTCTEAGYTVYGCSAGECGTTENKDPVAALGHEEVYDVIAPTCVAGGITNVTCSRCDYTATKDPTDATGEHKYDVKGETVEPTCTEAGYTVYGCSAGECGTTENKDPVAALGHEEIYDVIAPTCVAGGITNVTCSRCDYTATKDPTEATGEHKYDVKGETVEPTCSAEGYTVYGCSAGECGTTDKGDFVRRTAHSFVDVNEFDEIVCTVCSQSYRNIKTQVSSGNGKLCLGCEGDENGECTCEVSVEWNGYIAPEEVFISAGEAYTLDGENAKGFEGGLIRLTSAEEATLVIVIDGDRYELTGTDLVVDLYSYETIESITVETSVEAELIIYKAL